MASNTPRDPRSSPTPPQSIPLQDLAHPPGYPQIEQPPRGHNRGRTLLSGSTRPASSVGFGIRYERVNEASPSPTDRVGLLVPQSLQPGVSGDDHSLAVDSPIDNPEIFQAALGFAGLRMSEGTHPTPGISRTMSSETNDFDTMSPYFDSTDPYCPSSDSDQVPLTDPNYLQPMSGAQDLQSSRRSNDRSSFQSVRFNTPDSRSRSSRLRTTDAELGHSRSRSYGNTLGPDDRSRSRSRSPSAASPLSRAGSIMRAMSQRVVNISNDADPTEQQFGRQDSNVEEPQFTHFPQETLSGNASTYPETGPNPVEKGPEVRLSRESEGWPVSNPFKGKSLGIFSPTSPIRTRLCEVLVHPLMEPTILVLIILQTILLTVELSSGESAQDLYADPGRPWASSPIDYALLALFIIYTLEIVARVIVSGFFFNAPEYSTREGQKSFRGAIRQKYNSFFGPQRQASIKKPNKTDPQTRSTSIAHTFTAFHGIAVPASAQDQQRNLLARRAFLRHSLNRIDFVAVVSFWVGFAFTLAHVQSARHLYVLRMLSSLRILRLLGITNGTAIILKSLKKAAPLLVNVAFLIGFFWLLFAIIGVQAFKSSLSRQCVWIDPLGQNNYTNNFTLCGGYLDNTSGNPLPWILADGTPGGSSSKGYLCPRGSLCIEQMPLYNGTVSFDNIVQSLELVFVIMSANTFTDLMYYTTNSDYLAAALFFAAGIIIMMLWLTNLLIAVITSSFQVIREESRKSAFTNVQQPLHPSDDDDPLRRPSALKKWYEKTSWIWIAIITFNVVCQASRNASMSPFLANFLFVSEIVVTFLLLIEIIIRFASDWRRFHHRRRNLVDVGIAIMTTIILIPPIRNSGRPYAWLTVFQILRIYRLVWAVPITRELISKVLGNATGIGNLVLFVYLITFLVAILASQLFRGDIPPFDENGNVIRVTFFTIWNSFLGLYQVLSSENWTILLYNITAYDDYLNIGWIGAIFIIGWFILSFFILVNMFIAVIQENFDVSEDEKRLQQVKAFLQKKEVGSSSSNLALSTIFKFGRSRNVKDPLDYGQATMEMLLKDAVVKDFLDEEIGTPQRTTSIDPNAGIRPSYLSIIWGKIKILVWGRDPNPFYSTINFTNTNETLDPRTMAREAVSASSQRKKLQRQYLERHPMYNVSLFIFKPSNPVRRFCQKIVGPGRGSERFDGVEPNHIVWYTFSAVIYAAVVTMVLLACITTPLYQKEFFQTHDFAVRNWFVWTDLAFATVFTLEAVIKVIADGFFWTPNAYFRSIWGFVDGLVLVTLWINVVSSFVNDGAISRAVGAFKALRALRLLNVSDSARNTFHSVVFLGGWRVISAAFVSLSLLIPFAIYGVNLFSGLLVNCNDTASGIVNLTDCTGEWSSTPFSNDWNILAPRVASNPYYSFDDFGSALFILFQIVSQEGWVDVMWASESIVGKGLQYEYYASQGNAVFFVVFNLMATVFVLTLFISVFMRTYTEQTGVAFLTSEQRSWMELRKLLRQVAPSKRPSNKSVPKWKDWCYKRAIQKHGRWHRTVTVILVLHLILLMLEYYPEPNWWVRTRDFIFLVFTVFYIANIIIRIIGLGWFRFRRSSWDIFSLVAVFGTLVTTILLLTNYSSTTYLQLHKLFLVLITLLLIPRNNALDQLFKTAAASLTSIGNLLATWFVLFLVYAIAMTQTFGLTRFGSQETNNLNFRDVPKALIVLFRMSVGEGWNQIMEDYATIEPPLCVESSNFFDSDCGSETWARALFISWNILSMYIFVSMFVSLIYESFSYVYQRSSGLSIVTREEIRRFKQAWATFDPAGTGFITKEEFPRLLGELSGVFAMRIYDDEDFVHRILDDIQTQTPGSRTVSIATTSGAAGVDLRKLNARVAQIDESKVRERRRRFNIFYEEVMVSADKDRGISFNTLLMILAHYNIINDSKSLQLDEFLRRRARLQRVEEEVNRRIVIGFFDTLFCARRFRKHMDRLKAVRITDIPQFEVPEIVVDDEEYEDGTSKKLQTSMSPVLSPVDIPDHHTTMREAFGLDGTTNRPPRLNTDMSQGGSGSAMSSPIPSPGLSPHRPSNSVYSFEIPEPASPQHSRHGSAVSAVSAENVLEVFSESAWGESLRRSFTTRRSPRGP